MAAVRPAHRSSIGTDRDPVALAQVRGLLRPARAAGRRVLLEPEGLALLAALDVASPRAIVAAADRLLQPGHAITREELAALGTDRVVVKVVAESILHKTDTGGVAIVDRDPAIVDRAIRSMAARLASHAPAGYLVSEFVAHEASLGGELLVALRWTPDFGPIVAVGAGGIDAELLATDLRPGCELAVVSSESRGPELEAALRAATVVRLATEPQRGRAPLLPMAALVDVVERLLALAEAAMPDELLELEINPLAVADGRLVALDALARLGPGDARAPEARRAGAARRTRIDRLLNPRSIAIVGVSSGENIGRTILRNTLRDGFDPAALTVIKPGATEIDGCRCVPDVATLPAKVDLLVVAVSAAAAADLVRDAVEGDVAEAIVLIPGGLEETAGGSGHADRIRASLAAARERPGGGPVINGGNCMGIRSRSGRYDTLFVPDSKLAGAGGRPAPLAIVAQSGAFAISRLSRLEGLDPRYVITVGNQMDLTVGDHLEHLAGDESIRVFGVYVEGFAVLDGRRFLRAARAIAARGGTVVLYRAGRTIPGAKATASHTAAIAGDAVVTAALARAAGVIVADTLEAFDDLLGVFVRLDGRTVGGGRIGAMTNAGFECVAIADNIGTLEIGAFDETTVATLEAILQRSGLAGVVEVHNPFDLTPMAGDAVFVDVADAILGSPGVDVGLIGNVPFTVTLHSLPVEELAAEGSVAPRLVRLWQRTTKAWVCIVDAGPRYDPLARHLEAAGIPTFRTADAAMRTLDAVVRRAGRAT